MVQATNPIKKTENSEKQDHKEVFTLLYREYYPKLYKYIYYRVGNSFTTEDLVSEVFIKVLQKYDTYDEKKGKFSTWVFTIAKNTLINHGKKNSRSPYPLRLDEVDSKYLMEEVVIANETDEVIFQALESLSDRQREIIALKFGGHFNNREIAQITGLSESNVGTILYRSLKELKDVLKLKI